MYPLQAVMETRSGYNGIHQDLLQMDYQRYVILNSNLTNMGDANGNPPKIQPAAKSRVCFADVLHLVP